MTVYWILKEPAGSEYCAIYGAPEMRNFARPARGKSMGDTYSEVDFKMTDQVRGLKVPDVINNALDYLMVSQPMKDLIEANVTSPIEFLPFRLLNHKGRVAAERCYIVNVLGTIDCGDTARIEGTPNPMRPGVYFSVNRLFIDPDKVPADARMFRVTQVPALILIRDDLKQVFEAGKMKAGYGVLGEPL